MPKKVGILVIILLLLTVSGGWAAEPRLSLVQCGGSHSLVLKNDGTVWAWGSNGHRQFARSDYTQSSAPVPVERLVGWEITSLSAGLDHCIALLVDGKALAWGRNDQSQLGVGPTTAGPIMVPKPVRDYEGVSLGIKSISAGDFHTAILKEDGTVWYAGGIPGLSPSSYLQALDLTNIDAIASGPQQIFVLQAGKVMGLGANNRGQLGDGSQTDRSGPVYVRGPGDSEYLTEVVQVAVGNVHTLALRQDGSVWAWGSSDNGVLGNGVGQSGMEFLTPVRVLGPGGIGVLGDICQIAARGDTSMALDRSGRAYIWGKDAVAQGSIAEYPVPVMSNVAVIACGEDFRVLIKNNGMIYAWGFNAQGQTGVAGDSIYIPSPAVNQMSPLLGDFDADDVITVDDLRALAGRYGKYDPDYDLNDDNFIDLFDLVILAKRIAS